jgi:hypothetical protein
MAVCAGGDLPCGIFYENWEAHDRALWFHGNRDALKALMGQASSALRREPSELRHVAVWAIIDGQLESTEVVWTADAVPPA